MNKKILVLSTVFCLIVAMLSSIPFAKPTTINWPYTEVCNNDQFSEGSSYDVIYWNNFTTQYAETPSYSRFDSVNGYWTSYCNEGGSDDWADCIAFQGWDDHEGWYTHRYDAQGNAIGYPLRSTPYFPVGECSDGNLTLNTQVRHGEPVYTSGFPWLTGKALCPAVGLCVMLFFNVWANDTGNKGDHSDPYGPTWLFNYTDPDQGNEHNSYVMEIFLGRWDFNYFGAYWSSVSAYDRRYHYFTDLTTHDNDLHHILLPFSMPNCNEWYEFTYDFGKTLRVDATYEIEKHYLDHNRDIDVQGFQLMGVACGNEVISGAWTTDFDWVSIQDKRNLTRTSENAWNAKTRYQYDNGTQGGEYYRPTYACGANSTKNMTSMRIVSVPEGNASCDGDTNFDGYVNILDTALLSLKWGLNEGDSGWDYRADLRPDKTINIVDMVLVSSHYGETTQWYNNSLERNVYFKFNTSGINQMKIRMPARDPSWLIDLPICYNGSGTFYGLGSILITTIDNASPPRERQACRIEFYINANPSGTVDGTRFYSAIFEVNYPYS